jgi:phosphoribosylaminoimidazole-succinocarboxamide synthase
MPSGLLESQRLPEPIFTPSTKAEQGQHDENISPEQGLSFPLWFLIARDNRRLAAPTAAALIGADLYAQISTTSLQLYNEAASHATSRGLILADTKFEFGLIPSASSPSGKQLILIDELLTPDSSRYWPMEGYAPGRSQPSFDKQFVRDWLARAGFKKGLEAGKEGEGWTLDDSVVEGTRRRYVDAVRMLTDATLSLVEGGWICHLPFRDRRSA